VKPAELIDIREISECLTLADRRTFNFLLANAWENIQDPVLHHIRLNELRGSDKDNARPRDSIKRLMKVIIAFDVIEDGIKREVMTQLLGPCKLDHNPQGLAYYTFPEPIRKAIEHSIVFARLRRDLLCQFRSKYALSLYEMLQKRVNLSFKTSEDFTLEEIRQKLGVEKSLYPAYRSLNQKVIQPAKLEVNQISDIVCEFSEIKEGRKVVGLRLSWQKKTVNETVTTAQAKTKHRPDKSDRKPRGISEESAASEPASSGKRLRALNTRECEQLKKTFDGYDIYHFYAEFQEWLERTGGEIPTRPAAAFTSWMKSYYKITGPLQRGRLG
jgi:hypothetical protein